MVEQLAGALTAVQVRPMTLDEDAAAVNPVGAAGIAEQLLLDTVSTATALVIEPIALVTTTV